MPSAGEVQRYIASYLTEKGLTKHIQCNTVVVDAEEYDTHAVLRFLDGSVRHHDYVLLTGDSTVPNIPKEYTRHARPIHTSRLSRASLTGATTAVVIGGSKSAAEACVYMFKRGIQVTWIARKFHTYGRFESGTTLSLAKTILSLPSILLGNVDALFDQCINPTDDLSVGSGNILTEEQMFILARIATRRSNIRAVTRHGVRISSGEEIPCDVLILGTGYRQSSLPIRRHTTQARRVFFADADTPRLTTFGTINAHLVASMVAAFVRENSPGDFASFAQKYHARHGVSLMHYQVHYLLSTGNIGPFCSYSMARVYAVWMIALLVLVIAWRRMSAAQKRVCEPDTICEA